MTKILLDIELEATDMALIRALPGVTVEVTPLPHQGPSRHLPPELLNEKKVFLCRTLPINFSDFNSLQWIQIWTAGYEHLAPFRLNETAINLTNARGLFDTAIGEWVLAMMVNLVRDVPGMLRNQQAKVWSRDYRHHQELRDKIIGIWGYGGIGRETARLAKAFGMRVHVLSRFGVKPRDQDYTPKGTGDIDGSLPDQVFQTGQEEAFLRGLDFLVLSLPRTQDTTGRIGIQELRWLKPSAFLLNVARGLIIQEEALLEALRNGWIAGAALDVHYAYPLPQDHPLWEMPNVVLTPHISGSELSTAFKPRLGDLFLQNLRRFLAGEAMLNRVSKEDIAATIGLDRLR